jgi:hypothetical protein
LHYSGSQKKSVNFFRIYPSCQGIAVRASRLSFSFFVVAYNFNIIFGGNSIKIVYLRQK